MTSRDAEYWRVDISYGTKTPYPSCRQLDGYLDWLLNVPALLPGHEAGRLRVALGEHFVLAQVQGWKENC